jgi:alpha-ketoglutarate-dependent taurine dioxygenase
MNMDRLSAPSECRAQALHCRLVADTAPNEQVRTLWVSMAQTWTKLAEAMERLEPHQARYEERDAEVLRAVPRER